jgi:mannitol-1-/sugar-/sorbitol-6-phosphatase
MTIMRTAWVARNKPDLIGLCLVRTDPNRTTYVHPCAAVFFDMDGVLVDSSAQIAQALAGWARESRVDVEGMQAEAQSMTDYDFVRLVAPHLNPFEEVRRIQEREERLANNSYEMRGARQLYDQVPADHRAVVTNGCRAVACARLRSAGFGDPGVLVTADDVTLGKPDPEPYRKALATMGLQAPWVVAVEDSVKGATSARRAGLFVIGLDTDGGNRGLREVADLVVSSPADIRLRW